MSESNNVCGQGGVKVKKVVVEGGGDEDDYEDEDMFNDCEEVTDINLNVEQNNPEGEQLMVEKLDGVMLDVEEVVLGVQEESGKKEDRWGKTIIDINLEENEEEEEENEEGREEAANEEENVEKRGRKKIEYQGWHELPDGRMQCIQCIGIKKPVSRNNIIQHNRVHHEPAKFGCDTCGKVFKAKQNLKNHKSEVHNKESEVTCPAKGCGEVFSSTRAAINHSKKKHNGKPRVTFSVKQCLHCGAIAEPECCKKTGRKIKEKKKDKNKELVNNKLDSFIGEMVGRLAMSENHHSVKQDSDRYDERGIRKIRFGGIVKFGSVTQIKNYQEFYEEYM